MKTISTKEILDFVRAQPDDKMVNMTESLNSDPCGCVMVQYGRENNIDFDCCLARSFYRNKSFENPIAFLEDSIFYILGIAGNWIGTYGELKKKLLDKV